MQFNCFIFVFFYTVYKENLIYFLSIKNKENIFIFFSFHLKFLLYFALIHLHEYEYKKLEEKFIGNVLKI